MELAEKDKQAELELVRKIADLARLHFIRQKSPKARLSSFSSINCLQLCTLGKLITEIQCR